VSAGVKVGGKPRERRSHTGLPFMQSGRVSGLKERFFSVGAHVPSRKAFEVKCFWYFLLIQLLAA